MLYEYEKACKEAGCTEEQIAEIRRIFDADYKRLNRRNDAQVRNNIVTISVSAMLPEELGDGDYDIPDTVSVEEQILHEIELENLRKHMSKLPADDREFLYACFEDGVGCTKAGAARGLSKNQAHYKKKQLLEELRKKME